MADDIAPQIGKMTVGAGRTIAIDFTDQLESGELLTGTPTLTMCSPGSPNELTISNVAVNTATLTINGRSVAAGLAIQGKVVANSAGKFMLKATCDSDATPAQNLMGFTHIHVKASCS